MTKNKTTKKEQQTLTFMTSITTDILKAEMKNNTKIKQTQAQKETQLLIQ